MLRGMAAFRATNAYAISFYADLDPSTVPTAAELDTRLGSLLSEAGHSGRVALSDLTHDERSLLRSDLERIGRFFDEEFERDGARGLALFSCAADNLWSVLRLPQPVPDAFRIGRHLYLAPLVPLADDHGEILVVVAGREQGQIWLLDDGKLELYADHFEEQPRRHDQGGWSQSRFARHIESLVHEHLRDVMADLDRRLRRRHPLGLVVVAGEEIRPEIERLLSPEARRLVIGWTQAGPHSNASALQKAIQPFAERLRGEREARLTQRWQEELGRDGRACAGWERTLEAASDGRIEVLLCRTGSDCNVWLCGDCGRISARPGNCPLDGTTMIEQDDGLDLLVHRTLEHGGSLIVLHEPSLKERSESVGALLRY